MARHKDIDRAHALLDGEGWHIIDKSVPCGVAYGRFTALYSSNGIMYRLYRLMAL